MKFLKRFLIVGLALTCALLSACSFKFEIPDLSGVSSLGSGCARPVRPQPTTVEQVEEFKLDFSEDPETRFIFPKITGYMIREEVPDKITVLCVEKNYEDELEIRTLSFENGAYKIGFEEYFHFDGNIAKNETLTFKLCVYKNNEKTVLSTAETFTSPAHLTWTMAYEFGEDWTTGKIIYGLDNEEYWTDWV